MRLLLTATHFTHDKKGLFMSQLPISVCMIAKNEEKNIERCLSSLQPYGFEIILVDTGSNDRTKELAAKYTDKIYDFIWCDDFSAARNFSLEKASNNWIFMMDCDEWIESIDLEELDYFRKHLSYAAGSVTRENLTGTPERPSMTTDQTERFFSKKLFKYTGIIHEQLTPKYEKTFETFLLNTRLGHDGYCMDAEARRQKAQRNLSLLQKQLAERPDDPYTLYQLGKAYEITCDFENACQCYEAAIRPELDPELAYVQELVICYGEALLSTGQFKKALSLEKLYDQFATTADFVYLMGIIYLKNENYEQALEQFEKALTFRTAHRYGANSFLSYYEIGRILLMISEWDMAKNYFLQCGEYPPAKQCLQLLEQHT